MTYSKPEATHISSTTALKSPRRYRPLLSDFLFNMCFFCLFSQPLTNNFTPPLPLPIPCPSFSLRLHDPAGLHRAFAAPVAAFASAVTPAEAGVPPPAGAGQRHARSPAQSYQ